MTDQALHGDALLRVADLEVRYGRTPAVRGASLEVQQGEAVAIIGPNGAGKTTMLTTLAGERHPSSGTITFAGDRIEREKPERIVRKGIALVPEGRRIFNTLSVHENLRIGATVRRDKQALAADWEHALVLFPILREYSNTPAGRLSGGEQQQLAIARALLSKPRLLLLDEPSLGLAPLVIDTVYAALQNLRESGVTIVLVEQHAARAMELADRTYLMRTGRLSEWSGAGIGGRDEISEAYLGGQAASGAGEDTKTAARKTAPREAAEAGSMGSEGDSA